MELAPYGDKLAINMGFPISRPIKRLFDTLRL